jgi:hypothetical protein
MEEKAGPEPLHFLCEQIETINLTTLDALQPVQFVTVMGKGFALVNAEDWEALIE